MLTGLDASRLLEALYRVDVPDDGWLALVADELRPLLDRHGLGILACLYECRDPTSFTPGLTLQRDVPGSLRCTSDLNPVFVANGVLSRSWYHGADLPGWKQIPCVRTRSLYERGAADQLCLNAVELDGKGCWFGSFQRSREALSQDGVRLLSGLGRHLANAHRLRRTYSGSYAGRLEELIVVDAAGHVQHAGPSVQGRAELRGVAQDVLALHEVRKSRRLAADPFQTLAEWSGRLGSTWTVFDRVESDGTRLFFLVRNPARKGGTRMLSGRERQVLGLAVRGLSDKVIAHELELRPSTVRVLLRNARRKIGAESRRELLKCANVYEAGKGT